MITLQFCSFAHDLMSEAIDWFTEGTVGHVDAVLPGGRLLGAQYQDGLGGAPAGVQIRAPNYGGMIHLRRVSLDVGPTVEHGFYNFLQGQLGKPYDMTAIVAFVAGRDWREQDSWFCSELQSAALEAAGMFRYPLAAPCNKITPQELFLLLSAMGPVIEVS